MTNLSRETRDYNNQSEICIKNERKNFSSDEEKFDYYFNRLFEFDEPKNRVTNKGTYNDASLEKFISRMKSKTIDKRLSFLFGSEAETITFQDVLKQLLGYGDNSNANLTIIDLSSVPFEVLSITVSLISRLIFEYGYFYKKSMTTGDSYTPILLVYEEAHKYVPKNHLAKYNASRIAIERIAKEGRKYGVTAMIVSQRPSEVSETIFSQCSNFISMRLTNPNDQNYVKKLLPDSLSSLTESLPILQCGEAILIGDSITMPSHILIDKCDPEPSSNDIAYLQEWKKKWFNVNFEDITNRSIN